jgi:hypothetical protein
MTDEQPTRLQTLWRAMPAPGVTMSPDEMRARARALERSLRARNWREYIAAAVVIAAFGWYATLPEPATPLWPIANVAIILGTLVTVWKMRHLAPRPLPPAAPTATLVIVYRAELVRQRDGLRKVWLWYIGPSAPGFVLWFIALWIGDPEALRTTERAIALATAAGIWLCVSAGIIAVNLMAAAGLQRMIDAIDDDRS